ncbi:lysophospholipase [Phanerochaete sordida]|uniref:Lysophospholipase n=1 Tax=Phanerochaete sordida TaxID=48140 RepID=A0A9P3LAX4_9APHY|nr:lysophospholipase [Phanerochaete sordida]
MITSSAALALIFSLIPAIPYATAQTAASLAYTPHGASCPNVTQFIRLAGSENQTLSPQELSYISARTNGTGAGAWQTYLQNVQNAAQAQNVTLPAYMTALLSGSASGAALPNVGLAVSGGGLRAATFNAAVLNALDARSPAAAGLGTGGLLQAANYLVGSSGGSWLVGSLSQAGFPTLPELVFGPGNASLTGAASSSSSSGSAGGGNGTDFGGYSGWNSQFGFLNPSPIGDTNVQAEYFQAVVQEIQGKAQGGFPVSFADIWARVLARHFVNGTDAANFFDFVNATNSTQQAHGAGQLWSGLTSVSSFQANAQPFPIIVVDSISSQGNSSSSTTLPIPLTNVIYEFNPFEFGSYDPSLSAFIPTSLLGSTANGGSGSGQTVNGTNGQNGTTGVGGNGGTGTGGQGGNGTADGQPGTGTNGANGNSTTGANGGTSGNGTCVTGFDQTSFVIALSSNLFNSLNQTSGQLSSSLLGPAIPLLNASFPNASRDFLLGYVPNTFQGIANATFPDAQSDVLTLVDGSEDAEFVPFQPLLVKARNVDVIFASDASGNTDTNYPNGTSIITAAARAAALSGSYSFPPVPSSADQFVAAQLNQRPVFFGCNSADNATNATTPNNGTASTNSTTPTNGTAPTNSTSTPIPPLVIYLPNVPLPNDIALTNTSTFQDAFAPQTALAIIDQAYAIATRGFVGSAFAHQAEAATPNLPGDPLWPVCLACAVTDRARARQGLPRDGVCAACFQQYCFS